MNGFEKKEFIMFLHILDEAVREHTGDEEGLYFYPN
jgi:hypothetical protein